VNFDGKDIVKYFQVYKHINKDIVVRNRTFFNL
jgi:hypothetical protein